MRWFWTLLLGAALLVLDVSVGAQLRALWGGPDFLLIFVVFLSLYCPADDAPIAGWLLGLAKDCLSAGPFGLYAVLFLCLAFFVSRIRADIFTETGKAHMVNTGLATLMVYTGAVLWMWTIGGGGVSLFRAAMGRVAWNALLAPFMFRLFFRFSAGLGASRRPS